MADELPWLQNAGGIEGEADASLLRTILESISDAVFVVEHPSRTIVFCNAAACEMFGYAREELIGESTRPLHVDEEQYREFGQRYRGAVDEGLFRGEFQLKRADGTTFPTENVMSIIGDRDDPPFTLVSVVRDISRRVEARRQLEKSKEKFSAAFQVNPHSVTIVSLDDLRILEVNQSFTEITGYPAEEVIGRPVSEFDLWVNPSDQQRVVAQLQAGEQVEDVETRFRTADGSIIDALYSATSLELDGERCALAITQDISRRKQYERELEFRALHDSLTELPNRNLLRDRLEHALDRAEQADHFDGQIAVVFLDLDRFKVVNDTLGHPAGDQLLKTVGDRLRTAVRKDVTVARFGGDEFVLLIEEIGELAEARRIADDAVEAVEQPCTLGDSVFHPSVSVGIAVSDADTRDADDLLRYADVAMFQSKADGGSDIGVYKASRHRSDTERLHYENDLREAIRNRQFTVHYQPVVDLESECVVGAEALARWDHPDEGLISPATFIPVAEETGMIVPLGYQILEQAAAETAIWSSRLSELATDRPFRVAVNLSGRQYAADDLVPRVREVIDETGLALDQLVLELTESILMTGSGKLDPLREAGLRVAIDDFGTGYSSLQYLRQLEADILKIDRGFVADLDGQGRESVLIEAILRIADRFGMDVVIEGIETDDQLGHSLDLGGRLGQGFYFSRPVPAETFASRFLPG